MKRRKDLERTGNTLGKVKNPPKSEVDKYMQTHQSIKSVEAQNPFHKPKPTYTDDVIHKFMLVTKGMADVYSGGKYGILKQYNEKGGYRGLYPQEKKPKPPSKRVDHNYIDVDGNYIFKKRPPIKK